jgi:LacI family transcriptional regulator
MSSRPVTITDVARASGVSISTVSRVVNDTVPVGNDLRQKVLDAIDTLGYQPNFLAQNLRRQSTGMIGVVVPDVSVTFFVDMIKGIQEFFLKQHRLVSLYDANADPEKEIYIVEELIRSRAAGVIFASALMWEYEDHIAELVKWGIPVCLINRQVNSKMPVDMVLMNKVKGDYDATMHLINLGHRSIGCIPFLSPGSTKHQKLRGYRQAMNEMGIPVREDLQVEGYPGYSGGYEAAKILLARLDRPSAIFGMSDYRSIGAMHAAHELGIRVPEDLSIVGFGGMDTTEYTNPPLTTIKIPYYEMGSKGASMLLERMENKELPQREEVFENRLIVRGTTAASSE